MLLHFPLIIVRNSRDKITHVLSPDLQANILDKETSEEDEPIRSTDEIQQLLTTYIANNVTMKDLNIDYPRPLDYYVNYYHLKKNEMWTVVSAEIPVNRGIFEKISPFFAIGTRVLNSIAFAVTTFLALEALQTDKTDSSIAVSVSGTIFSMIMGLVIFCYSDAIQHSNQLARKIDLNRVNKYTSFDYETIQNFRDRETKFARQTFSQQFQINKTLVILVVIFYAFITIGDIFMTANVRLQSTLALGSNDESCQSDQSNKTVIPKLWVAIAAWTLAASDVLTNIIFEGSFAFKASSHAIGFLGNRTRHCCSNSEMDSNEALSLLDSGLN